MESSVQVKLSTRLKSSITELQEKAVRSEGEYWEGKMILMIELGGMGSFCQLVGARSLVIWRLREKS